MSIRYGKAALLMALAAFLAAPSTYPQPGTSSMNEIIQKWIQQQNSRLPKALRAYFRQKNRESGEHTVADNRAADPEESDLLKSGIKAKAQSLACYTWFGKTYLVAKYDHGGMTDSFLYLRKNKRFTECQKQTGCGDFEFITLGPKSPIFLGVIESGCASGWAETLYLADKSGTLQKKIAIGGAFAGAVFVDIDGDGTSEIINTEDLMYFPKDLVPQLEKYEEYKNRQNGATMTKRSVYKWDGAAFRHLGDYYRNGGS